MPGDLPPVPRHDHQPEGPAGDADGARLGPHVGGSRIVVRRLLRGRTGASGGPAMTDVLGVCERWVATDEDGTGLVVVRREDGSVEEIPLPDVVAGKPVPPRARRRAVGDELTAADADRRALPGWRPLEVERLGSWLLRASGGFSQRANSVLALDDPGLDEGELLHRVERWYAARGLPARAHVLPGGEPEALLTRAGWRSGDETLLMLARTARVRDTVAAPGGVEVDLSRRVDDGWLRSDERAARFGAAAVGVLEAGDVRLATVRDPAGRVVARGRGAVHDGWLGLSSLFTDEARRGDGLGAAILLALLDWGQGLGADVTYLQVLADNAPARALYAARGFTEHHRYRYLVKDQPSRSAWATPPAPGQGSG